MNKHSEWLRVACDRYHMLEWDGMDTLKAADHIDALEKAIRDACMAMSDGLISDLNDMRYYDEQYVNNSHQILCEALEEIDD